MLGEVLQEALKYPPDHGGALYTYRTMWRPQIEALNKAGYRGMTPDLRGFGESKVTSAAVNMSS